MSPCPKCGTERGMHLRLVVPWNPDLPVLIDHECRSRACKFLWSEVVTTPEGALKSALENRGTAPLSGALFVDAVAAVEGYCKPGQPMCRKLGCPRCNVEDSAC